MRMSASKAVFLDKDGTLIENVPYNIDPGLIRLSDGALEALWLLQEQGYQLMVVTNQSGVARGYFGEPDVRRVEQRLRELLSPAGLALRGFYYCPHHPEAATSKYAIECFCRKPQPGMLYQAAREHDLLLARSWLVGDTPGDIEAGKHAGCQTVLIDNSADAKHELNSFRRPDFIVQSLRDAADVIVAEHSPERNGKYAEHAE